MHLISYNWLPFYWPCSFASQTFIWFADFLIITLILMQKNWFYYTIALYCTQENITVLTTKIKKEQSIHILELFFYFRSPRSIDITVSCSFVLRSFHIPRTSFCFSVRFSELSCWKNCDNVTPKATHIFSSVISDGRFYCSGSYGKIGRASCRERVWSYV